MNDLQRFEQLKKNIEADPTNFQSRREFAMLLSDMGFIEASIKHLNYLVGIFQDDANLYFNLGICFEKLKEFKLALHYYKKAVELKPNEGDFIYNLALCYDALNMQDEAIREFKKVICLEKNDSNSFFCLGCLYFKKTILNLPKNVFKGQLI